MWLSGQKKGVFFFPLKNFLVPVQCLQSCNITHKWESRKPFNFFFIPDNPFKAPGMEVNRLMFQGTALSNSLIHLQALFTKNIFVLFFFYVTQKKKNSGYNSAKLRHCFFFWFCLKNALGTAPDLQCMNHTNKSIDPKARAGKLLLFLVAPGGCCKIMQFV